MKTGSSIGLAVMLAASLGSLSLAGEVRVVDVHTIVTRDGPPPAESGKELRLVAARGGLVSAQVVVMSDTPIAELPVQISDLTGNGAAIPKSAVRVTFPTVWNDLRAGGRQPDQNNRFDLLADKLVPGETRQPVWITVTVPAEAKPGAYSGQLRVAGATVPLRLTVAGYRLPSRESDGILMSIQQSPDAIAESYNVAPYSEAHLKLLEPSFQLLAQLGNDVLYVPLVHKTWLGHRHGLVQFRKVDGKLVPDFAAFDRFMATYRRHCGTPTVMILNVWEGYMWWAKTNALGEPINHKDNSPLPFAKKVWVSVIEGDKLVETELDLYPAHREMWQAVVAGFRQRAEKLGVSPENVLLGVAHDRQPAEEMVAFFRELDPKMKWACFTHGYGGPRPGYATYLEFPDNVLSTDGLKLGWNVPAMNLNSVRDRHNDRSPPITYRQVVDLAVDKKNMRQSRGFARLGLDQWGVVGRPEWRTLNAPNRLYRHATYSVARPGPAGALPTIRYLMLLEGLQEAQARVAIEKAVVAKNLALEGPLKELLDSRARFQKNLLDTKGDAAKVPAPDWMEQRLQLFTFAAEAQAKAVP